MRRYPNTLSDTVACCSRMVAAVPNLWDATRPTAGERLRAGVRQELRQTGTAARRVGFRVRRLSRSLWCCPAQVAWLPSRVPQ
jgi:hypothetical protein